MTTIGVSRSSAKIPNEALPYAWARHLAWLAVALGTVSFVGLRVLGGIQPWLFEGRIVTKANAALCMVLCGVSLALLASRVPAEWKRRTAAFLALASLTIAAVTMVEFIGGWDLHVDQALVHDLTGSNPSTYPGRMAFTAALSFLFFSIGLLAASIRPRQAWLVFIAGSHAAVVVLTGLLTMVGFGLANLVEFRMWNFSGLALSTGLGLFLLGIGLSAYLRTCGLEWCVDRIASVLFSVGIVSIVVIAGIADHSIQRMHPIAGPATARLDLFLQLGAGVTLMLLFLAYLFHNAAALERQQTEEKLRENQERLKLSLDAVEFGYFESDLATHVTRRSPRYNQICGCDEGQPDWDFAFFLGQVHPDDRGAVESMFRDRLHRDPTWEFECRIVRPDGCVRWIWKRLAVFKDAQGQPVRIFGIIGDITERKIQQRQLEEQQVRERILFEEVEDGRVLLDADRNVIRANQSFAAMLGYTREEVMHLHPWDWDAVYSSKEKVLERRAGMPTARERFESKFRRKDGTVFDVELTLDPGEWLGQKVVYCLCRDISERKHTEERLRQSQKMEAIGQFAGGIAHDFNNLLMIISSYGELVKGYLQGEKEKHYADELLAATSRGAALVRQLMVFSHKNVEMATEVEVNGVLKGLGEMVARLVGKRVDLQVIPAALPCRVNIKQGQLEQIILNLSSNARDAMPNGGILTIEAIPLALKEETREHDVTIPAGSYALIAVSDSGTGIPPEIRPKIFDPFFTTKPAGKGTGIGLATVKDIVTKNGGRISVVSELGLGTSFKIYLPLRTAEGPPPAESEAPGGLEHVLLVEDEAALRIAIGQYLRSKGYTVTESNSGQEAVKLPRTSGFDVLVTDVMMPGMTGMELANAMHETDPALPVLFISGYTDGALQRTRRIEPGAVFLQKPFALDALATKLRSVLAPSLATSAEHNRSAHV